RTTGLYNACDGLTGDLLSILPRLDPAVSVMVSAHTHAAYNCVIDGRIVTSAASFGRLITDIELTIDEKTGQVKTKAAQNVIVTRDVEKDADETALIARYDSQAAPLANRVVGTVEGDVSAVPLLSGEAPLGDVIADAMLEATHDDAHGAAVIAFMNPGGIRADLTFAQVSGGEMPGEITFEEVYTVHTFGQNLV